LHTQNDFAVNMLIGQIVERCRGVLQSKHLGNLLDRPGYLTAQRKRQLRVRNIGKLALRKVALKV